MNILVSIIIPVYNVSQYIERCLLSVLNQTYPNIEIILVNDCTPDNSMEIVNGIINNKQLNTKIIHHDKNQGLSGARNTGITNATGNYIYFLDSDDELPLNAIEKLVALATKYNPDFVIGNIKAVGTDKNFALKIKDTVYIDNNTDILNNFLNYQWYSMACNKLIKRIFLQSNDLWFYKGIYHEDELWSFQLATTAQSMAICYDNTYIYYINSQSITQTPKKKNLEDRVFILNKMLDIVQSNKKYATKETYTYIINSIFNLLVDASKTTYWNEIYSEIRKTKYLKKDAFKRVKIKNKIILQLTYNTSPTLLKNILHKLKK